MCDGAPGGAQVCEEYGITQVTFDGQANLYQGATTGKVADAIKAWKLQSPTSVQVELFEQFTKDPWAVINGKLAEKWPVHRPSAPEVDVEKAGSGGGG